MTMQTTPSTESFMTQMLAFNEAFLNAYASTPQNLTDRQMPPRERYEAACSAMERLCHETLELESQMVAALDKPSEASQSGNEFDILPAWNHMVCDMLSEGIKARAQLWDATFDQLHRAQSMIPTGDAIFSANPFAAWQELVGAYIGAQAKAQQVTDTAGSNAKQPARKGAKSA